MKNSNLYILKPILAFLLGCILVFSCSREDPASDIPIGIPGADGSEVVVKLLIKGEAILPPATRSMSPDTEGSYQDDLQLLILEKQPDGTYTYNCHRPVNGTQGQFTVKVPISLDGKDLKFILFANSKDIIGNPDDKFLVEGGSNKKEDEIRQSLLLTVNTQWDSARKIPMWAEDAFSFDVPQAGVSTPKLATLKLMRMLARVDVGLNYNGSEISSTAQGLANFRLKEVKVYHTNSKGLLMPGNDKYKTTGTGSDKTIEITAPSIPSGTKTDITPYGIILPDSQDQNAAPKSCEREIYLFEQQIVNGNTGFDADRSCILVRGAYTPPGGKPNDGWYRLDFVDFGTKRGYKDVLRNMLYRFNIMKVSGSGYSSEQDALQSVSSNITVELIPMELQQNDVVFDGQYFLSVNTSVLTFYQNRKTQSIDLTTNYKDGWKIDTNGATYITVTPTSGKTTTGSPEFTFTVSTPPTEKDPHIYIVAGNLKKKISIKYLQEDAPGNLQGFSLNPAVLYFLKTGGTGIVDILSNVQKKFLTKTEGELSFTIPTETTGNNFNVNVGELARNGTGTKSGAVNVQVKAANADITSSCEINQLTYEKLLTCAPAVMGHGVSNTNSKAVLSVPYTTPEAAGNYMISFASITGLGDSFSKLSDNRNTTGSIQITAQPNKTAKKRPVGKLTFYPALNGDKISLVGYTPKEFIIEQDPVPAPTLTLNPAGAQTLAWNSVRHTFTVNVDNYNFVENNSNEVLLTAGSTNIGIPSAGTIGQPITVSLKPNRTRAPVTSRVTARVMGWDGQVSTVPVEITQQNPEAPTQPKFKYIYPVELGWNVVGTIFEASDLNNIYEVKVTSVEAVEGFDKVAATYPENFTIYAGGIARLEPKFESNNSERTRKLKINVSAIGNIESEVYPTTFEIVQKGRSQGALTIDETTPFSPKGETRVVRYRPNQHINPQTLRVSSTQSWIEPVLNTTDQTITYRAQRNTTSAERQATVTLRGKDGEQRDVLASVNLRQGQTVDGSISTLETGVWFDYRENRKNVDVFRKNMVGDLALNLSLIPDWAKVISHNSSNSSLQVIASENLLPYERKCSFQISGIDAGGEYRKIPFEIKQNANVIRVPSSYNVNSGVSAFESKSFKHKINLETNSLPFDQVSYSFPSEYAGVFAGRITSIIQSDRMSFTMHVTMAKRDWTHTSITVPITVTISRNDGITSTTIVNVTREGSPPPSFRTSLTIPGKQIVGDNNVNDFTSTGHYIETARLRSGSYISARWRGASKSVRLEYVDTGGSPEANRHCSVNVHLHKDLSHESWSGHIRIYGTNMDGQEVLLGEIPINDK